MRHRFHSLCPYFAMFPESFAEQWIGRLTRRGDTVLDPFCGRGTTPFQAIMMGREAAACDVNDVAFCLTKAKTTAPKLSTVQRRIDSLDKRFDGRHWKSTAEKLPAFFSYAFDRRTLQQLCFLRKELKWRKTRTDAMVAALVLGSLHGEMDKSSSYLSNQMPRTISTKPAYSIKFWKTRGLVAPIRDVFDLLRDRAIFRYRSPPPSGIATIFHRDMRELPQIEELVRKNMRCAITSPPYLDVTNFEEDQWLRLWFLGGPVQPVRRRLSRDDRHTSMSTYWAFIADMWRSLGTVLGSKSDTVIRLGSRKMSPDQIRDALVASSKFTGRKTELVACEVSELRNRQTDSFRPGSRGCLVEVDCHIHIH